MTYKPRRARSRWLEGAPEYVVDVFDNKGKTADRYTVFFGGSLATDDVVQYLGLSDDPHSPHGVSMWGTITPHQFAAYRRAFGKERIRWWDLPDHIRAHVINRAGEE